MRKKSSNSKKDSKKKNKVLEFFSKITKTQVLLLIVFIVVFITILDLIIGHYHIFVIPKTNTWRSEYAFTHDNIDYYYGDSLNAIMFYGFFPTSFKKEIKSGRLKYSDIIKHARSIDPKCWCDTKYYITSLAKFIDCGKSPSGRKVVIIPFTSKFDLKYCDASYK